MLIFVLVVLAYAAICAFAYLCKTAIWRDREIQQTFPETDDELERDIADVLAQSRRDRLRNSIESDRY